jgi:hypothetical protein
MSDTKPTQFVLRTSKRTGGVISVELTSGERAALMLEIDRFFTRAEVEGFEALSFSILRAH